MSRRRVLLVADGGRALALVSIPVAAALHDLTLAQLYVVGVVAGVLTIFFSVAYPSYLQSVVTKDELVEGNSLLTGAEQVAHISGPALGGGLVQALGAAYALIADVASFVVSVVAVFAIRAEEPPPVTERRKMRHEVVDGVRFLMDHKVLRAFIVSAAISNLFAGGAQAITVLFLVRVVRVQPGVVGLLLSVGKLPRREIEPERVLLERTSETRIDVVDVVHVVGRIRAQGHQPGCQIAPLQAGGTGAPGRGHRVRAVGRDDVVERVFFLDHRLGSEGHPRRRRGRGLLRDDQLAGPRRADDDVGRVGRKAAGGGGKGDVHRLGHVVGEAGEGRHAVD